MTSRFYSLILICLAALLSACSSQPDKSAGTQSLGGSCDYNRQQLLAKLPEHVIIINNKIELETSDNSFVAVDQKRLQALPKQHYFEIDVSTRVSGDCEPTLIHQLSAFQPQNINITPDNGRLYQVKSVLEAAKSCLGEYSTDYCRNSGLIGPLNQDQASLLRQSNPHQLQLCSASSITNRPEALENTSQQNSILACTPGLDDTEIMLQISAEKTGIPQVNQAFSYPSF